MEALPGEYAEMLLKYLPTKADVSHEINVIYRQSHFEFFLFQPTKYLKTQATSFAMSLGVGFADETLGHSRFRISEDGRS